MKNEVVLSIKDCLNNIMEGEELPELNEATNILDLLNYDSLNIMSLILEIETAFGFEFEEDELDFSLWSNFENLVELVCGKLNGESI